MGYMNYIVVYLKTHTRQTHWFEYKSNNIVNSIRLYQRSVKGGSQLSFLFAGISAFL